MASTFAPRPIRSDPAWDTATGTKIYTISAVDAPVARAPFLARLAEVQSDKAQFDWAHLPAFAICHAGAGADYLVLCWWGNDNELFTSTSVRQPDGGWVIDPDRWSFCLWDLEVLWGERNLFVEMLYSGNPDLAAWRAARAPCARRPAAD